MIGTYPVVSNREPSTKKWSAILKAPETLVILSKAKNPIHVDSSTAVDRSSLCAAWGLSMKEHQYFVYIMSSRSGTLYIGVTNSIYRRALQHKSGEIEGFASKYHCTRLVHLRELR